MRAKRNSTRTLVALFTAGVTLTAIGLVGYKGAGATLPSTDLASPSPSATEVTAAGSDVTTTTIDSSSSNVSLDLSLQSHPAHSVCSDLFASTGTLPAGCPLIATLTVTNNGSSAATNVVVTAPQPGGWIDPVVTYPPTGCGLADGPSADLTCQLGTLAPGESSQIVVQGETSPSSPETVLSAVCRVSADGVDQTPESSIAAGILQITPQADLAVKFAPDPNAVIPGSEVPWSATVTNNGPSVATHVRVFQSLLENLDADYTGVSMYTSADATESSCSEFAQNRSTARCGIDAMNPGETFTMDVTGIIASDITEANYLVQATVGVSSFTTDPDNTNNNGEIAIRTHAPEANLLAGASGPDKVAVGDRVTFEVTVEDGGPSDAPSTRLDLQIPDALENVHVTSDHGTCDLTGCDLGTLLASVEPDMPGNTANISITGTVKGNSTGSFDISGTVAATADDPIVASASFTKKVVIDWTAAAANTDGEAQADVAVSGFSISPLDQRYTGPGSQRRVQFTVTNNGPDPAYLTWYRQTRSLDAEPDLTNAMADLCQTTPREIMCAVTDVDNLLAGESVDVDYTITLSHVGRAGNYTDYIHVYSQTSDPDETNNFAQTDIVIGNPATSLEVSAVAVGTTPNTGSPLDPGSTESHYGDEAFVAGGEFSYEITVAVPDANLADAAGVVVVATLPEGVVPNSARTASGLCSIAAQVVTCRIPTASAVEAESSTRIVINGMVDQNAVDYHNPGHSWVEDVPMDVTVTASTPGLGGNKVEATTSVDVDIIEQADLALYVTPDQSTTANADSVGYTMTVLNQGPSAAGNVAVSVVVPDGYELDYSDSYFNCTAPTTAAVDPNGDGVVELTPLASGFQLGDERSVLCQIGPLGNNKIGNGSGELAAGQAGSARLVFTKVPGHASYADTVTFVAGSLATDPDATDNTLDVPLNPTTTQTVVPAVQPMPEWTNPDTTIDNAPLNVPVIEGVAPETPVNPLGATALTGTDTAWERYYYPLSGGTVGTGSLDWQTDLPGEAPTEVVTTR